MTEPTCRPFRMSDAMILIAASAVGFAEARPLFRDLSERSMGSWIMSGIVLAITLLPAWSISFVAMHLRRPRPTLDRLWKPPGAMACLAGGIPSVLFGILSAAMQAVPVVPREPPIRHYVAGAILSSVCVSYFWWLMKATNGWKPEPGWLDRCGVVLGFLWVSITVIPCLVFLIWVLYLLLHAV